MEEEEKMMSLSELIVFLNELGETGYCQDKKTKRWNNDFNSVGENGLDTENLIRLHLDMYWDSWSDTKE